MIIAKNIISSYFARVWLGMVSFFSIPFMLNRLGIDAYGILSLSLIVVGYSLLLDFGLGRGVVKYIAEYNALNNEQEIKKLVRSSMSLYLIIGIGGAFILALFTKFLLNKIFKIPVSLHHNASMVFYLTACGLFFRLPQTLFQSIVVGYKKIYLLNLINAVFNTLKIIASVIALYLGYFLVMVVTVNIAVGIGHLIALCLVSKNMVPVKSFGFGFDTDIIKKISKYSIKTFSADFLGMLITYVDKIIIGIFLPIANLAIYTVPFEFTCRIWEFQVAAVSTTFPNFSEYSAAGLDEKLKQLYMRVSKFVVVLSSFLSSIICVFAHEILTYWISPDFALKGQGLLRIFSWGILTSSILSVIGIVSYGAGRLGMPIKINSAMIILHIILCLILIRFLGITGVAVSWISIHVFGISIMAPWINRAIIKIKNGRYFLEILKPVLLGIIVSFLTFILSRNYIHSMITLLVSISLGGIFYTVLVYFFIFNMDERRYVLDVIKILKLIPV